ncbi:hypothetical protein [Coprobacillus sp. AF33-1AC]|uniref:hypothetical protein n=1 Tax=Coprobacillus sp. AF33-1AC TaxID=2292032 RepID=UPI000E51F7F7|nr:hypothetical protein [Coprobacillus sp. AF33-1AC]RHM59682.1 hypothetical protein DWZ53_09050 [Coprobacillus sp. AF33-1AC]
MSKDREGYMKEPKGLYTYLIEPSIKGDLDKDINCVINATDQLIKGKKDEDIVIHCKGIQLYPKKLNSLSHAFDDFISDMKNQLSDDEYKLLENKIKTLQSLIDDLKENCSVSLFLY